MSRAPKFKTVWRLIELPKIEFETELTKLHEQEFVRTGELNTILTPQGIIYTQLMSKTTYTEAYFKDQE